MPNVKTGMADFYFFLSLCRGANLASNKKRVQSFGTLECAAGQSGREEALKSLYQDHRVGALSGKRQREDLGGCHELFPALDTAHRRRMLWSLETNHISVT